MGEVKKAISSKQSSLEAILDDEIFGKKETGFFKKIKQGIEKAVAHHRNEVIIPLSLAVGGAAGFIAKKVVESNVFLLEELGRSHIAQKIAESRSSDHLIFGVLGAAVTYLVTDYVVRKHIGKKIIATDDADYSDKKAKKEKNNFIVKHRLSLSLATGIPLILGIAKKTYLNPPNPETMQILAKDYDKAFMATIPYGIGFLAGIYFFYDQLGKFLGIKDKDSWKNMGMYLLYQVSKKDAIKKYEEESKKGNVRAIQFLSRVKEDLDEKLEWRKKVIELQEKDPAYYGREYSWTKPFGIGNDYYSFKRKKDINILIDMAMKLYDVNRAEALRIFDKLANAKELDINSRVLTAKTYFLNHRGHDTKENWQELRSRLESEGKMQLIEGSEGKTSKHFDDFTNKNFIFKDYSEDKSDKFFIERGILKILKDSRVSVENPLFYYDEEGVHRQVFIRNGEKNLREALEGKPIPERRDAFEKVLPLLMLYQQKISSALGKKGSEYFMDIEFRGEERRITIPVLDLERSLVRRAFTGSNPGEMRLGKNEFLPNLLNKIQEYNQLNKYEDALTFNRGDTTAANITETLCIIDPRPCIAHQLYDLVYMSGDPIFIPLSFNSRKEKVLEIFLKRDELKTKETDINKAFDLLYLNLTLSNAGANLYLGKRDLTKEILEDLVEFSRGKCFEKEIIIYLKHSNASGLI